MNSDTPTPETNRQTMALHGTRLLPGTQYVDTDFARKLERERDDIRDMYFGLREDHQILSDKANALREALKNMQAIVDSCVSDQTAIKEIKESLRTALNPSPIRAKDEEKRCAFCNELPQTDKEREYLKEHGDLQPWETKADEAPVEYRMLELGEIRQKRDEYFDGLYWYPTEFEGEPILVNNSKFRRPIAADNLTKLKARAEAARHSETYKKETEELMADEIAEPSLLEWLEENAAELVVETWAIADSGDYDSAWAVYEETKDGAVSRSMPEAMGWGNTPALAIMDAMKSEDDPTKYNYVPPEYRNTADEIEVRAGDNNPPTMIERLIRICPDCYDLKGDVCHEPECAFCRRTMEEVGFILDATLIRPVVDGERLSL